jgi:hypothetical protein
MITSAEEAVRAVVEVLQNDPKMLAFSPEPTVLEGDHNMIASTPTVCVYPGTTSREYVGVPRRVQAEIGIELMVYHGALQKKEENQQEALQLIDIVVEACERDASLNGDEYVINSLVRRVQHGEAVKGNSKYFASRINLTVTSRFTLEVIYA